MKKILIALFIFTPLVSFAQERPTGCGDNPILGYYHYSPVDSEKTYLAFITLPDVKISSLEATIGGENKPVQFKEFDIFTRARVLIEDTSGVVETTFNVQRENERCDNTIRYSFSIQ